MIDQHQHSLSLSLSLSLLQTLRQDNFVKFVGEFFTLNSVQSFKIIGKSLPSPKSFPSTHKWILIKKNILMVVISKSNWKAEHYKHTQTGNKTIFVIGEFQTVKGKFSGKRFTQDRDPLKSFPIKKKFSQCKVIENMHAYNKYEITNMLWAYSKWILQRKVYHVMDNILQSTQNTHTHQCHLGNTPARYFTYVHIMALPFLPIQRFVLQMVTLVWWRKKWFFPGWKF